MAVGWREGKAVANSRQKDQRAKAWKLRKCGFLRAGTKSASARAVSPEVSIVLVT